MYYYRFVEPVPGNRLSDIWSRRVKLLMGIVVASGMLCGGALILYMSLYGQDPLSRDSRVSELSLCESVDPVQKLDTREQIRVENGEVFLCGFLEARTSIELGIYLFKMGNAKPVYTNPPSKTYSPGIFWESLTFAFDEQAGDYRVDVYRAREVVGSLEFSVGPP